MLTPDKIKTYNGVEIYEYFLHNQKNNPNKINLPGKRIKPLKKITIHNTADLKNVEDDGEQYSRATVNDNMGTVVPDYYVDDIRAWQLLDGSYNNWTNADGSGPGNTQSISIECIMHDVDKEHDEKAFDNCARLTAYLLHKNGLKEDDIVTHTFWLHVRDGHTTADTKDVDYWCTKPHPYKTCPLYIIPRWTEFKALVAKYYRALKGYPIEESCTTPPVENNDIFKPYTIRVVTDELNVRTKPGTGSDSKVVTVLKKSNIKYTIVKEAKVGDVPWGFLKSGIGWVSLLPKYVKKD